MKKIIPGIVLATLLIFPAVAEARTGDKIKVQKKDGQTITGELIRVQDQALVIIVEETRTYASVPIEEARVIITSKKGSHGIGAFLGFFAGSIGGGMIGNALPRPPRTGGFMSFPDPSNIILGAMIGGFMGSAFGGSISSMISGPRVEFKLEGRSSEELDAALEILRSRARYPNL